MQGWALAPTHPPMAGNFHCGQVRNDKYQPGWLALFFPKSQADTCSGQVKDNFGLVNFQSYQPDWLSLQKYNFRVQGLICKEENNFVLVYMSCFMAGCKGLVQYYQFVRTYLQTKIEITENYYVAISIYPMLALLKIEVNISSIWYCSFKISVNILCSLM